jgi:penicillin-binding protein 2
MTARLVNGGRAVIPRLTRVGPAKEGGAVQPVSFPSIGLNPLHLKAVIEGMAAVCQRGGTAFEYRITEAGLEMGGKTGSAQVKRITMAERQRGLRKDSEIPWADRDNAFFVAFAPVQAPRYACSVVVEHGLHGGEAAAPIAHDILLQVQKMDDARTKGQVASGDLSRRT